MEARMAEEASLAFKGIAAGKYRRVPHASLWSKLGDVDSLILNARDLGRTGAGVAQSLAILRRFKPDVVFCKGGFVALPVGVAARLLGVPLVIHESDIVPGLGTKILARWAQRICVGFPENLYPTLQKARLKFTGNPVRAEVIGHKRASAIKNLELNPRRKNLLILGGSQGAVAVNDAVMAALPVLIKRYQIIHVTGMYDLERVNHGAKQQGIGVEQGYVVVPFLNADRLGDAYAAADLVISRAGANTIAELAANRKATILIPNRLMAAHQLVNARRLAGEGAVEYLDETETSPDRLTETVDRLLGDPARLLKLEEGIAAYGQPKAAQLLAKAILEAGGRVEPAPAPARKGGRR
jgi:UDP-N-acetylglucosamine--N-acetylmuramyl-(pentapeptide) pyrophosphoryl-undecaprenol N-acetylglucosamine transferase